MNLIELSEKFPDELSVIKFFENIRWGNKIRCAYCNGEKLSGRFLDHRHSCKECRKSTSVKVGTCLHNTKLTLKTWVTAAALISDAKKGISAKQLQRNLGLSYETAWSMYMTIRGCMEQQCGDLSGIVEMDETYVGGKPRKARRNKAPIERIGTLDRKLSRLRRKGFHFKEGEYKKPYRKEKPKRGRGTEKIPVVGIVQRDGSVIAEVMKITSHMNLRKMIEKHTYPEKCVLVTDSFKGYNGLTDIIEHIKIDHQEMFSYRGVNSNSIESFWAIIKRGITGQYHQVSAKYLPKYIDEFCFKYNHRKEDSMFETICSNLVGRNEKLKVES